MATTAQTALVVPISMFLSTHSLTRPLPPALCPQERLRRLLDQPLCGLQLILVGDFLQVGAPLLLFLCAPYASCRVFCSPAVWPAPTQLPAAAASSGQGAGGLPAGC